jgi:hypothetical protein
LVSALKSNSEEAVLRALQKRPDAAKEPLWDLDCEPPLCCAARFQCNAFIVKMLLDYGADPTDKDRRGNTPLQIVQRAKVDVRGHASPFYQIAPFAMNQSGLDLNPANFASGQNFPPFPQAFDVQQCPDADGTLSEHFKARESWRREVSDLLGSGQ